MRVEEIPAPAEAIERDIAEARRQLAELETMARQVERASAEFDAFLNTLLRVAEQLGIPARWVFSTLGLSPQTRRRPMNKMKARIRAMEQIAEQAATVAEAVPSLADQRAALAAELEALADTPENAARRQELMDAIAAIDAEIAGQAAVVEVLAETVAEVAEATATEMTETADLSLPPAPAV